MHSEGFSEGTMGSCHLSERNLLADIDTDVVYAIGMCRKRKQGIVVMLQLCYTIHCVAKRNEPSKKRKKKKSVLHFPCLKL